MDTKQKNFVRRKLIPFILREHGRGFGMTTWCEQDLPVGELATYDGVTRKIPVCGTAACIGGSTCLLIKARNLENNQLAAKTLGLTSEQASGLFYNWGVNYRPEEKNYRWPIKYAREFEQRSTPYGKARVAARLLQEVVRTNGECLFN